MSAHLIYYKDGAKMMMPVLTKEEYMAIRNGGEQRERVKRIRSGEESLKHKLVQMNYSCLPNEDGTLKGSTRMSNTVGMDIDHIPAEELQAVKERILRKKDELGLLMLEESARGEGLHLVFKRHPELSQEENLRWASDLLGVEFDAQAKDITRVFFTTTGAQLLYLDDAVFEVKEVREVKPNVRETETNGLTSERSDNSLTSTNYPKDYHGIPFTDIIRKYWEMFNDGKEPVEGDRDSLTYELACVLRHICGRNADWLDQVIPCYDGFPQAEKRKKIESALQAKIEGMPYRLKQVLRALKETAGVKACGGTTTTPPPMPKKLPPLIKLLTKNVPWYYKPAVASAVFPALGAHLHGVKFRYCDNVLHEATFMNVLVGRQSIGKGSIKKPIEYIMEDIRQRDKPNRQREDEWKQKNSGAKPKKDPRPTDICIQMLIDNLTDAIFNQRVIDANNNGERFIYTIVDEIEGLKKVTSRGTADEVGLLIRKAFDNTDVGQERYGSDSVSGIAPLRWNFNASTTPPNARKFFYKMVNDGTVSRLDISTIIRTEEDDDTIPVLGIYDNSFAQELKPFIDRLEAANGLIECPQAKKLALEIKKENSDAAKLYESDAYRVLSYRANVIAWLKGMVLYVANGYKWSKEIADFVRWSEQYNLWCKMLYFGQQLERELREEVEIQRQSGPQNLLELLSDEFTKDQYRLMRQQQGKSGDGDSTLRVWQNRGYIVIDEVSGHFCKTDKYINKYKSKS